ncbi:MAG TPA: hypothetical protein PK990_08875 [Salinivirgaceae bacterium]|nr:hypothetical protein [Salinivirgaceae bacterium]
MKRLGLTLFNVLLLLAAIAQDTVQTPKPIVEQKTWGNIFSSFRYETNTRYSAFEMPTALIGYSAKTDRFKGTLVLDVSRTTGEIAVNDTSGNPLTVSYREGSNYTVFLKMAELKYTLNDIVDFKMGQLLNTQYLTTQDKFWGYRYVYFTYQEVHRYGNPADFGIQTDIKIGNKALLQLSVTNGEGPFRYQDSEGKMLYAFNAEWFPLKGLILKLYSDYAPSPDTTSEANWRQANSLFAGFNAEKFKIGSELNWVRNYKFLNNNDFWGISSFVSITFNPKWALFYRHDYINRSAIMNVSKANYMICGIQYQPLDNLQCSVNLRSLDFDNNAMLFFSVGGKF